MLDRKPTNKIIDLFNSTTRFIFQERLKTELPLGVWNTLNHNILIVKYKRIQQYNPKINRNNLKSIIAFLITLYELDHFSKILVAVGIPEASEVSQIQLYSKVSQYYIIRWLPGMLTSRFIMSRDFVRSTLAKSAVVRYNLKYMKTTVYKLYNLPDLLILTSLNNIGKIISKEAVLMKLPTIGLASNTSFPEKIAFKFFGDTSDLRFIRSFLCLVGLSIQIGREIGITSNFLNNTGFIETIGNKICDISKEPTLSVDKLQYDFKLDMKSHVINTCFENLKLAFTFFFKLKLKKFIKFYKFLKLNVKKNDLSIKSHCLHRFKQKLKTKEETINWHRKKKENIKRINRKFLKTQTIND